MKQDLEGKVVTKDKLKSQFSLKQRKNWRTLLRKPLKRKAIVAI